MRPTHGLQIAEVSALLSADCNLRCSYCYQDRKRPGTLEWPALRAALDILLASPADPRGLTFAGGEPTLAFGLVRRGVQYLRRREGARPIVLHLVTNGLLLRPDSAAFLVGNGVALDLSFDGVSPAQDLRSAGTFRTLDALIEMLRERHADYLRRQVAISVTVAAAGIRHLADSFAYFLSKGVTEIGVQPAIGQEEWSEDDLSALNAELGRIVKLSMERLGRSRDVPFAPFRWSPTAAGARRRGAWGCSAPLGRTIAVEVDGQVVPCALLARSYQQFAPGIDERVRLLSLGDVRAPGLADRLEAIPGACRRSGLFEPKRAQHSGERACAGCRERVRCLVCPVARVRGPRGGDDPNDIPAYLCAYHRILGKHRRHFLALAGVSASRPAIGARRILDDRRRARRTLT
jgi:sulfatase maturation enzyme AslB (radical SAM superfamily)